MAHLHVSLDDLNPNDQSSVAVSSPRSLEACARRGVAPEELLYKPKSHFRVLLGDQTPKEIVQLYQSHFETKRQNLIQVLKSEYREVIKELSRGLRPSQLSQESSNKSNQILENEKKKIAMLEKQQHKEIQQIMDRERQLEEIQRRNE